MTRHRKMSPDDRAFYKALGSRMAQRREELELSQTQLAATLRISQQTYAAYEVARYRVPASMLPALADALKTDIYALLGVPARNASSKRGAPRRST